MTIDFSKIEKLRKQMMLSQKDMAELLSVSRQQYINYVNGKFRPRKNKAEHITRVVSKVVDLLLEGKYVTITGLSFSERYERLKALL